MTRAEQRAINNEVETVLADMLKEYGNLLASDKGKRLRNCKAVVFSTSNYHILKSYSTIVACIDKRTDICYDFLRKVYGYTRASGGQIAKFRKDYGAGTWGCEKTLIWRDCND